MWEESACKSAAILEEYSWQTVSTTGWSSMEGSLDFMDKTLCRADRMMEVQSTCMELQVKTIRKTKRYTIFKQPKEKTCKIENEKNDKNKVSSRVTIFLL